MGYRCEPKAYFAAGRDHNFDSFHFRYSFAQLNQDFLFFLIWYLSLLIADEFRSLCENTTMYFQMPVLHSCLRITTNDPTRFLNILKPQKLPILLEWKKKSFRSYIEQSSINLNMSHNPRPRQPQATSKNSQKPQAKKKKPTPKTQKLKFWFQSPRYKSIITSQTPDYSRSRLISEQFSQKSDTVQKIQCYSASHITNFQLPPNRESPLGYQPERPKVERTLCSLLTGTHTPVMHQLFSSAV